VPLIFYFRFEPEHVENIAGVDWNSLQIVETHDEEGRIALIVERATLHNPPLLVVMRVCLLRAHQKKMTPKRRLHIG